jgi:hypothetical protein
MDSLDRYLRKVARALPRGTRDDIIAELRDVLLSRLEERAGGAGRPLGEEEVAQELRAFGHPLLVAGRYGRSEGLVPAVLVPFYKIVLSTAVGFIALFHLSLCVVRAFESGSVGHAIAASVPGAVVALLAAFTAVTIVFMALGRRVADEQRGARSACLPIRPHV